MTANQFDKKTEAWSAPFSEPMSEPVQRYTASLSFDKRLRVPTSPALRAGARQRGRGRSD